jgi:hypothetical protein
LKQLQQPIFMCNTCIYLCLYVCLTGPYLHYNYVTSFSSLRSDSFTQRAFLSACTLCSLLCCKVHVYNQRSRNELHVQYKPRTICSPVISHYTFWLCVIRSLMESVKPDSLLDILRLCKTRNLIHLS